MACEHGAPTWMECAECRRTSKYGFHVNGGTPKFHGDIGDLPPSDEVDDYNAEHGKKRV